MAFKIDNLGNIQYIPSTAGAVFTNPAATTTGIKSIVLFNSNTTAETVKIYNVPNSGGSVGTASGANQFFEQSIPAKATRSFTYDGAPFALKSENDTIQAVTTTANKVTIQLTGGTDA